MPSRSRRLRHTGADSCHSRSGSVSAGRRGRCCSAAAFTLHANLVWNLVYSIIQRLLRLLMHKGGLCNSCSEWVFPPKVEPKGVDRPLLAGCVNAAPEGAGTRRHRLCLGYSTIRLLWEGCLCGRLVSRLHSFVRRCSEQNLPERKSCTVFELRGFMVVDFERAR